MAPKLEVLKGTGGSIRVGTTGTIGSLMTKELDMKCTPQAPIPSTRKSSTSSVSVPCGALNSPKKLQPKTTINEAGSSSSSSSSDNGNTNHRQSNSTQKTSRSARKSTHRMPILTSDSTAVEATPNREKVQKKGSNLVEVVDIRCGNPHKWSTPLANRFKKLNSSKLSETIG